MRVTGVRIGDREVLHGRVFVPSAPVKYAFTVFGGIIGYSTHVQPVDTDASYLHKLVVWLVLMISYQA